jgi:hypothetical protein
MYVGCVPLRQVFKEHNPFEMTVDRSRQVNLVHWFIVYSPLSSAIDPGGHFILSQIII